MSHAETFRRRDEEQRERLFDKVSSPVFDLIQNAGYPSRVVFERWSDDEQVRVETWFSGQHEVSDEIAILTEMLNESSPNKQAALGWFKEHKQQISIDWLMQLVSETRVRAIADSMGAKTKARQETYKGKKAEAIRLWKEEYEPRSKSSKNKYAAEIAKILNLQEKTVRGYLTKA